MRPRVAVPCEPRGAARSARRHDAWQAFVFPFEKRGASVRSISGRALEAKKELAGQSSKFYSITMSHVLSVLFACTFMAQ